MTRDTGMDVDAFPLGARAHPGIVHGEPMSPRSRTPASLSLLLGTLALVGVVAACGGSRSRPEPAAPAPVTDVTPGPPAAFVPPALQLPDGSGLAVDCIGSQTRGDTGSSGAAARDARTGEAVPRCRPDLVLYAEVSADEVRFAAQPEIRVSLGGCAALDTVRVLERRNLPQPVVVGQTYRNVFVAVEILGYLEGRCLAERVGARRDTAGAPQPSDTTAASADCAALETSVRRGSGGPP